MNFVFYTWVNTIALFKTVSPENQEVSFPHQDKFQPLEYQGFLSSNIVFEQ